MSPRWNWDSPTPSLASEYAPSPGIKGWGTHSPAGGGLGESQFRRLEKKLTTLPTLWSRGYPLYNIGTKCREKLTAVVPQSFPSAGGEISSLKFKFLPIAFIICIKKHKNISNLSRVASNLFYSYDKWWKHRRSIILCMSYLFKRKITLKMYTLR